jgi:hypothetical protein
MRRSLMGRGAVLMAAVAVAAIVTGGQAATAASGPTFTGSLVVSSTTVKVGTPITVTENAINTGGSPAYPVIVGIQRLGFTVTSAVRPRTGICRIAGSATCNFLNLAPFETQSYTLTLVPNAPGSLTIKGWTTSQSIPGQGFSSQVTVTVTA